MNDKEKELNYSELMRLPVTDLPHVLREVVFMRKVKKHLKEKQRADALRHRDRMMRKFR